jgi:hypothetical protein
MSWEDGGQTTLTANKGLMGRNDIPATDIEVTSHAEKQVRRGQKDAEEDNFLPLLVH